MTSEELHQHLSRLIGRKIKKDSPIWMTINKPEATSGIAKRKLRALRSDVQKKAYTGEMNILQAQPILQPWAEKLVVEAGRRKYALSYEPKKHQLLVEDKFGWLAKIYLPWTMDWVASGVFKVKEDSHFSLVLIRAGQAATGYFHLGELIDHKVFRAYMIRQKQGVSQIKYLKTKGKSRSGSRVRLAESERFFEDINSRLIGYAERFPMDFWGISCARTMWPFYFSSEISPPFSQKEEKLIELPFHVAQASLEELIAAGELVQRFHLILSERGNEIREQLLPQESDGDEEENW